MVRRLVLLFVLVSFIEICFADETVTYLVYTNSVPDSFNKIDLPVKNKILGYENILDKGRQNDSQPFRITQKTIVSNTNYVLVTVTPNDAGEKDFFDKLVTSGKIKKISGQEIISHYDTQRGGYISEAKMTKYGVLPADFYGVIKSTP